MAAMCAYIQVILAFAPRGSSFSPMKYAKSDFVQEEKEDRGDAEEGMEKLENLEEGMRRRASVSTDASGQIEYDPPVVYDGVEEEEIASFVEYDQSEEEDSSAE